jgi:hypothetical protein
MERGGYATVDQLIQAALGSLEQVGKFGDFEAGELDSLIAHGEANSGEGVDAEQVFEEIRQLSRQFREQRPNDDLPSATP